MGNKFTRRRRPVVEEIYTRPQGLYEHRDLDYRKLRRHIVNGHLAPCFPGSEEPSVELDECPICFLSYPSLNRSKCCTKCICTECYLQIRSPHSARPAQCPFCKTPNYGVEYRGAKSKEEKGVDQVEEQKLIEAKIRIRRKELYEEEQRMLRREENWQNAFRDDLEAIPIGDHDGALSPVQPVDIFQPQDLFAVERGDRSDLESVAVTPTHQTHHHGSPLYHLNREDNFDLEDLMIMEAIWLSIQDQSQPPHNPVFDEQRRSGNLINTNANSIDGENYRSAVSATEIVNTMGVGSLSNISANSGRVPNAGHLADHSRMNLTSSHEVNAGSPANNFHVNRSAYASEGIHVQTFADGATEADEREQVQSKSQTSRGVNSWSEATFGNSGASMPSLRRDSKGSTSDWMQDHSSEAVEVGTSFSSSVLSVCDLPWEVSDAGCTIEEKAASSTASQVPDNFEEQIMLAMALSLADAGTQKHTEVI